MRYRIKICGLTDLSQALNAAASGADAIGLVFYSRSRRAVTLEQARAIVSVLPPFVASVALFVDPANADVEAVLKTVHPDFLQFHGDEPARFCESFGVPYLKAVAMAEHADPRPVMDAHPRARGFLLDSHGNGKIGGSGERFDWASIPAALERPWLLAGGLDAGNVGAALAQTDPYGVDVSSGVESAPGQKDAARVREFVQSVRQVERERNETGD
ncbi:Phosphoribosylanthranilate isomerase [Thioalkalivibrio nitratireducens DSM 14787]|uniref:N-(5'-phosphoribosyl)anthranilate isomerase n=1 Tax=Thioalkalivibrio nitratireducens (strain DSM 14787 / UNIQEM 213 / ALEN2) TaxID=1255043 RepID=L0DV48_THIND|nr:phosphoribosylanthranilate isomerase [Thioalkalivibrio nitratireducens]AGA32893.1 Phosphoribosylanthranilate isomerase [Thioalkalivibrio nitratireducens DSM 14787]